jgi:hypothetical protein
MDDEELAIAVAFCDSRFGTCGELVFESEIFWGTIIREEDAKTKLLTQRNNNRIDALLLVCFPFVPVVLRLVIANFLHLHF